MRAESVRGHRCVIIGIGFGRAVTMLCAGKVGQLPGGLTTQPPTLIGRITVAPAVLLAVSGCCGDGTRRSEARRISAAGLCRWLVIRHTGGADEPDQELIRAHK